MSLTALRHYTPTGEIDSLLCAFPSYIDSGTVNQRTEHHLITKTKWNDGCFHSGGLPCLHLLRQGSSAAVSRLSL
jgi:hypothetical protein